MTRHIKRVHFFRIPPFYYFPLVIGGMSLTTIVAVAPELIPYDSLWHLGTFLHYMAYNQPTLSAAICYGAWIAHLLEAGYAYRLCRKLHLTNEDTFKWCLQTFILGVFSFGILKAKWNQQTKKH